MRTHVRTGGDVGQRHPCTATDARAVARARARSFASVSPGPELLRDGACRQPRLAFRRLPAERRLDRIQEHARRPVPMQQRVSTHAHVHARASRPFYPSILDARIGVSTSPRSPPPLPIHTPALGARARARARGHNRSQQAQTSPHRMHNAISTTFHITLYTCTKRACLCVGARLTHAHQ